MKKYLGTLLLLGLAALLTLGALAGTFSDIPAGAYYEAAAVRMAQGGYLSGYGDGKFGGDDGVTRAQIAALVCKALGKTGEAGKLSGATPFSDVPASHWSSGYVNYAANQKIIAGTGDGKFHPDDRVKYEEVVKVLVCILLPDRTFTVDPADWSKAYLAAADELGLLQNLIGKKGEPMRRSDIAVITDACVTALSAGGAAIDSAAVLHSPDVFNKTEENSHATDAGNAYLEGDARSYLELSSATTGQARYDNAQYPRLKRLADGSYILFWNYGAYGQHIYYAKSEDLVTWSAPQVLYNSADYKHTAPNGASARTYFVNCDAAVLPDGTLFTVASGREVADDHSVDYLKVPECNAIYACVSHDNGETFEKPYKIYIGTTWEPSVLALPDGEIQVFFSQVSPGIVYWGQHSDRNSTGTGLIVSRDGGKTWTPNVTGSPYQAKIAFQQYIMDVDGTPSFTDQMSVATLLYDGTVAAVCESKQVDKSFKISLIHSDAEWSEEVPYDKEGPSDRVNGIFTGAGPYIVKMPSGETVVNYTLNSSYSYLRVGDGAARKFGAPTEAFCASGYWGSIEVTGNNRLTAVFPVSASKNTILLKNFYLNHTVKAPAVPITVDGKNSADWADVTDALFLGNGGKAQATLRAAYRDGKLYLLAERRDDDLSVTDTTYILLADTAGKHIRYAIDSEGNVTRARGAGNRFIDENAWFPAKSTVLPGENGGIVTEIEVNPTELGLSARSGCMVDLVLVDGGEKYTLTGTDLLDASTWLLVSYDAAHLLAEYGGAVPAAPLAPGEAARADLDAPAPMGGDPESVIAFGTAESVKRLTGENGVTVSQNQSEGFVTVEIKDNYDPYVSVVCGKVDADAYKYAMVRYRVNEDAGGGNWLGFYFTAGDMGEFAYTAKEMTGTSVKKDGKWHTAVIDLSDFAAYKGNLKAFRLDPFDGTNAHVGDKFDVAWIAFVPDKAQTIDYMD